MTTTIEPAYRVVDPSTGEVIEDVRGHSDAEIAAAVDAASVAHPTWSAATSIAERTELLRAVARLYTERRETLAELAVREMGKTTAQALDEVDFSAAIYTYYADNAEAFLADEAVQLEFGTGTAVVKRQSYGVLLGIMPWNYPYYQVARFAAPNLAAGNTLIVKHAPQCPKSAAAIEQIFTDAGLPHGAYVNVYASIGQVERLIADPRVRGISLTGSERAGSAVAALAGRHLKKVVLELGGSDPFILLSTDDLDATVDDAVVARLGENNGQACNSAKRFIVHSGLYDEFVEKFTNRMLRLSTAPLSSEAAAERLEQQVHGAVDQGAVLHSTGERAGAFYPPGVLTGVQPSHGAFHQELFGPVAMVFKVDDETEAVRLANDTPYGLGSYLYTTDPDQAARVATQIEAGMVFVNGVGADGVELPFGGVKNSGFGRELGRNGIGEFINYKLIRTVK